MRVVSAWAIHLILDICVWFCKLLFFYKWYSVFLIRAWSSIEYGPYLINL